MTRAEILEHEILNCKANGITGKRTIAKLICEKYPQEFPDIEQARGMVRVRTGAHGAQGSTFEGIRSIFVAKVDDSYDKALRHKLKKAGVYLITSAVNNTPINKTYWENLKAYASYLKAEIVVIAIRYKNPTSVFTDAKDDYWCDEVLPYLTATRHEIGDFSIMGDVKIQPTAENPLNGLEGMSGEKTCIVGHPRIHMKYLPVAKGSKPKMMLSTGSCTLPNYTDSKAGKKGEFHHTPGFSILSITKDYSDVHYVSARSDGGFIDYNLEISNNQVTFALPPQAIVFGDLHIAQMGVKSLQRIDKMINTFKPSQVVFHDVFDGKSINHHEANDPIMQYKRLNLLLDDEIQQMVDLLDHYAVLAGKVVVVRSNHDEFIGKYINGTDWKKDLKNAPSYARLIYMAMTEQSQRSLMGQIIDKNCTNVIYLDNDESYTIDGIEVAHHGHQGANGSKGSPLSFRRLSTKLITGHSHTPSRTDGHLVVGCQDLYHGYNTGLSSWGMADVFINADGKTQHIFHENE